MDLVLWIDIFEVSISIANLRNELKCILKATLEIKFSGVAFLFYNLLILFYQIVDYFDKMYCILSKRWYYIVVRKNKRNRGKQNGIQNLRR